jgi:hypothetical protein
MVLERDSLLLDGAADHGGELLDTIETEMERIGLDGTSEWSRMLARLGRDQRDDPREFVVVTHQRFPDVRHWIGCRPVGIHLEILTMTAVMPSWLKRRCASVVFAGEWWRWSLPRGLSQEEEIRTWLTALREVTSGSAKGLLRRLAGANATFAPAARDALAEW